MKITIPRSELKEAVAGISRVTHGRQHLPILNSVRFDAANGTLTATATNLDETLQYRFQRAQADDTGTCIIPFQTVKELAKGSDSETVDLAPVDEETVAVTNHVGTHAVTHNVTGFPVKEWPCIGDSIPVHPAERLLPTYRRLVPFVSQDATRRVLTGIYVDFTGDGVTLVATDGRRLTCCNSINLPFKIKNGVIVPVTKFLTWAALGDEAGIGIGKDGKMLALETGPWTYRTRITDGTYPNWRQVLPSKADCVQQFVFTDADVETIRKLLPALPGGEGLLIIGHANGSVGLAAKDAQTETPVQLTSGSTYTGPGACVQVNRYYLMDALNAGFRNFGFATGQTPLRAEDAQGAIHVLMLLRTGIPTPPKQAEKPVESTQTVTPTQEEKMSTPNTAPESTALEKLQAAYEVARTKVREANQALTDVAIAIRDAAREDKARRAEVENVRAGLQKLQAIRV